MVINYKNKKGAASLRTIIISIIAFCVVIFAMFGWLSDSFTSTQSPYYNPSAISGNDSEIYLSTNSTFYSISDKINALSGNVQGSDNPSSLGLFQLPVAIFKAIMIPFDIMGATYTMATLFLEKTMGVNKFFIDAFLAICMIVVALIVIGIIGRNNTL